MACYYCKGVHTDPRIVAAMQQWPIPKDIKSLRGVFRAQWVL